MPSMVTQFMWTASCAVQVITCSATRYGRNGVLECAASAPVKLNLLPQLSWHTSARAAVVYVHACSVLTCQCRDSQKQAVWTASSVAVASAGTSDKHSQAASDFEMALQLQQDEQRRAAASGQTRQAEQAPPHQQPAPTRWGPAELPCKWSAAVGEVVGSCQFLRISGYV